MENYMRGSYDYTPQGMLYGYAYASGISPEPRTLAVNDGHFHKKVKRENAGEKIPHEVPSTDAQAKIMETPSLKDCPPPSPNADYARIHFNFPGIRTDWQAHYPVPVNVANSTWANYSESQPVFACTADYSGRFLDNSKLSPFMMSYPLNSYAMNSPYALNYTAEGSVMTRKSGTSFPSAVSVITQPQAYISPFPHPSREAHPPLGSRNLDYQRFAADDHLKLGEDGCHSYQQQTTKFSMLSCNPLALENASVLFSQQGGNCSATSISSISNEPRLRKRKALARNLSRLRFHEAQQHVEANFTVPTISSLEVVYHPPIQAAGSNAEAEECDAVVKPKHEGGVCSFVDLRRRAVENTLLAFEEQRLSCLKSEEERIACDAKGFCRRADLKAATIMRDKGLWMNNTQKVIGNVAGVQVGDCYNFRIELCILGLHRQHRAGIDFITANNSAFNKSIATSVVIGKHDCYGDDMDMGETVIYTGQGGLPRKLEDGEIVAEDQRLVRGNMGLKNSYELHIPVRVIRGHRDKNKRSGTVYTYDGLYLVNDMKFEVGVAGNYVFKFLLQRMKGQQPLSPISSRQAHMIIKSLPPSAHPPPCTPLLLEAPQEAQCQSNLLHNGTTADKSPATETSLIEDQSAASAAEILLPSSSPALEAAGAIPAKSSSSLSSSSICIVPGKALFALKLREWSISPCNFKSKSGAQASAFSHHP